MKPTEIVPSAAALPVDQALRETEIIVALGIILNSLESLSRPEDLDEGGLLSWRVNKTRGRRLTGGRAARPAEWIFTPPGVHILTSLRLTAAVLVVLPGVDRRIKAASTAFLAVSNAAQAIRSHHGLDGSDHANFLVCTALAASRMFPRDPAARQACTAFIAGQSVLSYVAAGAAKAVASYWRDGTAMQGIFRTRTYGTRWINDLFARYPLVPKAAGWSVWVGEMLFPAVLVAPKPVAAGLIATGASFHAGSAAFMGLNRFVWAFGAMYPCVRHHSKHLSKR